MNTYMPNPDKVEKKWYLVDAEGQTLGRLSTEIAKVLRGKNKPEFTPFVDVGDYVIVVNAEKIALTGSKRENKMAYHHSGFPGGLRAVNYAELLETHPERAIEKAVRGMLPKNRLARQQIKKLKVYAGPEHPHESNNPEPFELTQIAQ